MKFISFSAARIDKTLRIKASLSNRFESETVRSFTDLQPDWETIKKLSSEIADLISHSNRHKLASVKSLEQCGRKLFGLLVPLEYHELFSKNSDCPLDLRIEESLDLIPWELLHDGNNFLCMQFDCGRLIDAQGSAVPKRTLSGLPLRMLIVADPSGRFKYAEEEGKRLVMLHTKDLRIDFRMGKTSRAQFEQTFPNYDLVHFAGHLQQGADPGWEMDGGILSPAAIHTIGTGGIFPRFVFSNSCGSTGVTGLTPMAKAFLFSGASHFIGTMADIGDKDGADFAEMFYSALLKHEPIGKALRKARLALKRTGSGSLIWASYVCYGPPNETILAPKRAAVFGFSVKVTTAVMALIGAGSIAFWRHRSYHEAGNIPKNREEYAVLTRLNNLYTSGAYDSILLELEKIEEGKLRIPSDYYDPREYALYMKAVVFSAKGEPDKFESMVSEYEKLYKNGSFRPNLLGMRANSLMETISMAVNKEDYAKAIALCDRMIDSIQVPVLPTMDYREWAQSMLCQIYSIKRDKSAFDAAFKTYNERYPNGRSKEMIETLAKGWGWWEHE